MVTLATAGVLKLSGVEVTAEEETLAGSIGNLTFHPAANANGAGYATFTFKVHDGTVSSESAYTMTMDVTAVNDVPSFTKGGDQQVAEDCGEQSVSGWATSLSAGPANEASQALDFVMTNDNNGLFAVQPAVAANGTLSYTPAADAFGTAIVTVRVHDDGGTAGGGVDTSEPQTCTIAVTGVNDAPSFTKGADQEVSETAGQQTVAGWATAICAGPANESSQEVAFEVDNDNNDLFSVQPAVSAAGTLSYTVAGGVTGTAVVSVTLGDDGGTAGGGVDESEPQTFWITVSAVSTLYWDPDGNAANNNLETGEGLGGSGGWLSADCWFDPTSGTHTSWNNQAGGIAVLWGSAGTVSLASGVTVDEMALATSGYTVSGASITLVGEGGEISVAGGRDEDGGGNADADGGQHVQRDDDGGRRRDAGVGQCRRAGDGRGDGPGDAGSERVQPDGGVLGRQRDGDVRRRWDKHAGGLPGLVLDHVRRSDRRRFRDGVAGEDRRRRLPADGHEHVQRRHDGECGSAVRRGQHGKRHARQRRGGEQRLAGVLPQRHGNDRQCDLRERFGHADRQWNVDPAGK